MTPVNIPPRERALMNQLIEMDEAAKTFKIHVLHRLDVFVVQINVTENTSTVGHLSKDYPGIDDLRDMIREFAKEVRNA